MIFYVRSRSLNNESEMLNNIHREIRAADPRLPVLDLMTMRAFHERGLVLWALRAAGRTLSAFGIVALVLAAVGVYGLKSYLVSRRTREIGIRIALGARPKDILWLVLRDGARTTIAGLAIGFPLAIGLAFLLRGGFVGVQIFDPLVMFVAPSILVGAAAIATYVPARRATRVTPLDALRTE
jgi:ABC-type lipoprotein release transport system permease subunit